jgi:hypothetical protein
MIKAMTTFPPLVDKILSKLPPAKQVAWPSSLAGQAARALFYPDW